MKEYILTYDALRKLESIGVKFYELDMNNIADLTALFWACSTRDKTLDEQLREVMGGRVNTTVKELLDDMSGEQPTKKH